MKIIKIIYENTELSETHVCIEKYGKKYFWYLDSLYCFNKKRYFDNISCGYNFSLKAAKKKAKKTYLKYRMSK
jgi:hypothetical protein